MRSWWLALVLASGCGVVTPRPDAGEGEDAGVPDAGVPDAGPHRIDWSENAPGFTLGPFEVESCGRLVLCATHPAHGWGVLGLDVYNARTYDRFAPVWDGGMPALAALRQVVADSQATVVSDRQAGCPVGSTVELMPTRDVLVGGRQGVAWGFSVYAADGGLRERTRQYATERDDGLFFFNASGLDRTLGCLEVIGEFTPAAFALVEPYLDGLARDMVLPPASVVPPAP